MKIILLAFTFSFVCCQALIYDELIRELSAKVAEGQVSLYQRYTGNILNTNLQRLRNPLHTFRVCSGVNTKENILDI